MHPERLSHSLKVCCEVFITLSFKLRRSRISAVAIISVSARVTH
jgi:hypothetical protein